jgi:succinoglycan biosynthesis protein ExoO
MPTGPLVSVVIPAYNTATMVGAAIESCLRQTITDIEVLVVDDGSTDDTVAVVRGHTTDPRVRLIELGTNRGVSSARNAALDAATGTWIATLDADDWMTDDRLEVLLEAAASTGADMIHDDLLLVHEGETEPYSTLTKSSRALITEPRAIDLDLMIDAELGGRATYRVGLAQPLIRRELLESHQIRYDPALRVGEDYLLYLDCVLAGARWIQIPSAHYVYVQRTGSATSRSPVATIEGKLRSCEGVLARTTLTAAQRVSLERYRANLRSLLAYKRVTEAVKARHPGRALRAVVTNPLFVKRLGEQLPAVVKRRWAYHVRHDEHALDMLPQ